MVRPSASTSLRPVVSKREHAPYQPISPKKMGPSKVAVVQQFSCLGSMVVASDDSETEFGWQDWLSQMRRLYLHHTEAHPAEELKERLGLTTIEYYLWSYLSMALWSRVLRYAGHVVRMQPDKLPLLQMLGGGVVEAIFTMELPKRHATSLAGSRFMLGGRQTANWRDQGSLRLG